MLYFARCGKVKRKGNSTIDEEVGLREIMRGITHTVNHIWDLA